MGTETLESVTDGDVASADKVQQYKDALDGAVVPRDSSGAPKDSGADLGSTLYRWAMAYIVKIGIGAISSAVTLEEAAGKFLLKIAGTTKLTVDSDGIDLSTAKAGTLLQSAFKSGEEFLVREVSFMESGTWDVPAGVDTLFILAAGGGGGGGGGAGGGAGAAGSAGGDTTIEGGYSLFFPGAPGGAGCTDDRGVGGEYKINKTGIAIPGGSGGGAGAAGSDGSRSMYYKSTELFGGTGGTSGDNRGGGGGGGGAGRYQGGSGGDGVVNSNGSSGHTPIVGSSAGGGGGAGMDSGAGTGGGGAGGYGAQPQLVVITVSSGTTLTITIGEGGAGGDGGIAGGGSNAGGAGGNGGSGFVYIMYVGKEQSE